MARYVGLGKETTYGTAVAATRYAEAIASIKPDQGWIIPQPIAGRAFRKRNLGPYRARGTIGDFPVEPENIIGELLLGVLGSVSSQQIGATGVYTHTFEPADTIPSFTTRIGVEQTERILPGCLVNSLTVKFAHDKDIQANAEILSGFQETKGSITTPTISELQALNMHDADSYIKIGGVEKQNLIYDLEITINNNIPFDRGDLSGRTFSEIRVGQRVVTGKLSAYFDETDEYDRFIDGEEFNLILLALGPIAYDINKYFIKFELRKCVYLKDVVPDVKPQSEPLVVDAPFQAFFDSTKGWEIQAILQNKIASY